MGKLKIYPKSVEISEGIFQDAITVKKTNTAICYFTNNDDKEKYLKLFEQAPEILKALKEFVRMYEEIQPAGGWQGVYENGKYLIEKIK
jgi:hypothetical protein